MVAHGWNSEMKSLQNLPPFVKGDRGGFRRAKSKGNPAGSRLASAAGGLGRDDELLYGLAQGNGPNNYPAEQKTYSF